MRYIPMSYFGAGDFEQFSTANIASPVSGQSFGEMLYPNISGSDISVFPMEPLIQRMVFNTGGTGDTLGGSAVPYTQPFFTRVLSPVIGAKTYEFIATSSGPSNRFINYTGTDFVTQSINMGHGAFSKRISCLSSPAPTISGFVADTSVTEFADVGYNSFQSFNPSNRAYKILFASGESVIATGSIAVFNYVDTNGVLQNHTLASGSTIELDCQTSLHLDRGDDGIQSRNLSQTVLGPSTERTVTPYPYHDKVRKYRITPQFNAGTLFGQVSYTTDGVGSTDRKYASPIGNTTQTFEVFAKGIPMQRKCAMSIIEDISDWNYVNLVTGSTDATICTDTNSEVYVIGSTGSINPGNTIYTDYTFSTNVGAGYWREQSSTYYVQTNSSGLITTKTFCNTGEAKYDINSGSVLSESSGSLSDISGFNNNATALTVPHFVSGTFETQQTLEVNTPSTNSGSAEIKYIVPADQSPTGSYSVISAFYCNGSPIWDSSPGTFLFVLGEQDDFFGIRINNADVRIQGGNFVTETGAYNNTGWNLFQYSVAYDSVVSRYRINYNLNGSVSGSFLAPIGDVPQIENIYWNYNDAGSNPDGKLANGSHFALMNVSLEGTTTSSMDTLFTQYNRYGL